MSEHWYTIKSLDDLAGYFAMKAREMNEISQKRTGLQKHHYAGQAYAYNDCAIMIRSTRMETKGKGRKKDVKANSASVVHKPDDRTAGEKEVLDDN